jgi:hypothetical protein
MQIFAHQNSDPTETPNAQLSDVTSHRRAAFTFGLAEKGKVLHDTTFESLPALRR